MINTNKVLTLILIASIVFSIGSTIHNLNRLTTPKTTSHAIQEGTLSIKIESIVSITTVDSSEIYFGPCKLLETPNNYFTISSEGTNQTYDSCTTYQRNNISVRNNGNLNVLLYISSNAIGAVHGGTFLDSPSNLSDISFKITNAGRKNNKGGCATPGLGFTNYVPFQEENYNYLICEELTSGLVGTQNSVVADFKITIPEDIPLGFASAQITFLAMEV